MWKIARRKIKKTAPPKSLQNRRFKVKRVVNKYRKKFPRGFPFWARLKISKNRTTLVIDEEPGFDRTKRKFTNTFVHREAIHTYKKDYEEIIPNPDKTDPKPMYLKRPSRLPQRLFKPHNKQLDMPEHLKKKYSRNNK